MDAARQLLGRVELDEQNQWVGRGEGSSDDKLKSASVEAFWPLGVLVLAVPSVAVWEERRASCG